MAATPSPQGMDPGLLLNKLIAQTCDVAIVFLDARGTIVRWSGGAAHVFGHEASEVEGRPASVLFTAEDRDAGLDAHEQALAASAGSSEDDRWMVRRDGSRFWASGVLTAIADESGALLGFVKILRNRTDLKEQIETARAQIARLEEAMRGKRIFLSTLSHELRGPLAPITNALQILSTSKSTDETGRHMIKVIDRQLHMLRRLVDDLLDATRLEHGKMALAVESLSLRPVLEAVLEDTRGLAREKGHRVELILPAGDIRIQADHGRIHQVFANLVTNAIKYTPSGGSIRVSATVEGDEAVTRIEDSGIGIDAEMLPRIFELFTQVDSARPLSDGGLGIGLSLVRDLVSLHGGTVQVRSDGRGKGSEFVVRLPIAIMGE